MTPDMKRLVDVAFTELPSPHDEQGLPIIDAPDRRAAAEAIVRAVLTELRNVSPEGFEVMEVTMKRPRMRVGHKASDDARGAYLALDAYVDLILDTVVSPSPQQPIR